MITKATGLNEQGFPLSRGHNPPHLIDPAPLYFQYHNRKFERETGCQEEGGGGRGGLLPYINYKGLCGAKRYGSLSRFELNMGIDCNDLGLKVSKWLWILPSLQLLQTYLTEMYH